MFIGVSMSKLHTWSWGGSVFICLSVLAGLNAMGMHVVVVMHLSMSCPTSPKSGQGEGDI